ncbi:MAG: methyltransferase domain-containing protein [Proteobacteria bacterium]|nr:methyltransferase domain-containing protein [Pseudomonadota bacterium]
MRDTRRSRAGDLPQLLSLGGALAVLRDPARAAGAVTVEDIEHHYSSGTLLERLNAALIDDGADPAHPTIEALAPYDQFHGRGMEATEEIAGMLSVAPTDRLLDIGSGIGGPARYMAHRFGCRVTGIDLTAEFCDVARHLTRLLALESQVGFELGNALSMPFPDASFDGAYSMNVSMNIADKAALYGEIRRVLKPGGWLMLSELAQGPGGPLDFPTPWAATGSSSFLSTPEETRRGLEAAGFEIVQFRDAAEDMKAYGARSKAMVERGEKPPHRAVQLIHGDAAVTAMRNTARGVAERRIVPVEILSRRRG